MRTKFRTLVEANGRREQHAKHVQTMKEIERSCCSSCGYGIPMPGSTLCRGCDAEEEERFYLNERYADWGGGF